MAKRRFKPTKENCRVLIEVDHETEKAYAVCTGTNGKITRTHYFYEFVAKSICYTDAEGNVYAPEWATRDIPFSAKKYV